MLALRFYALLTVVLLLSTACSSIDPTSASDCSGTEPYDGPPRRSVSADVWTRDFTRPIDGTLTPALTERFSATLDSVLSFYPAASVAIALPGEGMWTATRGVDNSETGTPVSDDALFQVASITKAFTAAVVLQLVEENRLSLEAPVARWFPDAPNADLITVEDLLTHTSGLVSFNALGRPDLEQGYRTPEELVEIAAEYDPQFCPGTAWAYTNTGYVMLGRIVEAVEGRPLNEVLAARLFDPLDLDQTFLRTPNDEGTAVVRGHASGTPIENMAARYATPYASGSLVSVSSDLVRFWHALLGGAVLPASTVQASFEGMYPMQPLIPAPPGTDTFYGQGVQFTDAPGGPEGPGPMLEHSGGMPGFNAIVAYLVEDDAYIALAVSDKDVPAAAGLWRFVQTLRTYRAR